MILFINRTYAPDSEAVGQLLTELAEALADKGFHVEVLATNGQFSGVKNGVYLHKVGGEPVFSRNTFTSRTWSYLRLYPHLYRKAWKLASNAVVVTSTDPPLHYVFAVLLKKLRGAKLVHWSQDLYPEVAEELQVLKKGGFVAGWFRHLSTWALKQQDTIICVGRCMQDRLQARGIPLEKIRVIQNWTDVQKVFPIDHKENPFRNLHHLEEKFVVMYSGNFGLAHPFDEILESARILKKQNPRIRFVLIGDGPRKSQIEHVIQAQHLDNVLLLPYQPKDVLAQSLSAADLHLATMFPTLRGLVVPSKVYGIMAVGRPALFIGSPESEVARLIQENDAGDVLENLQTEQLVKRIEWWSQNPRKREIAGLNARNAIENKGLTHVVTHFEAVFQPLLEEVLTGPVALIPTKRVRQPHSVLQERE
ncbi:MAG: glycosyltransferase family 4 protein [Bacteroidetes Order II. Incertae sedis bacterium]|nr:glycosyltransferase family 4 protein [Bacteroidetes Order II. bacterium]